MNLKETELFEPVKSLLQELGCSDVYGEILNFDVVGLKGPADVIVEMKTTLNAKVIEQAYRALSYGHYVYIAVPFVKTSHFFLYNEFLAPKGIGLIYVRKNTTTRSLWEKYHDGPYPKYIAEEYRSAKFNHNAPKIRLKGNNAKYDLRGAIKIYAKENVGGSKGGTTITDYSYMISKVKEFLLANGPATIETILENVPEVSNHYKNPKASLKATLKEKWNSYWIEISADLGRRNLLYSVKLQSDKK